MTRLLTKKVPYTFNRAGYYYFSRRVPADLLSHYSYPRIVQGLKTRSSQTAKSRALVAAAKHDMSIGSEQPITLYEALETYVTQKGNVSQRALKPRPRGPVLIWQMHVGLRT